MAASRSSGRVRYWSRWRNCSPILKIDSIRLDRSSRHTLRSPPNKRSKASRWRKIMHKEVIEGYELSPQQRRLWRLQQGSTDFVAQCVVAIEGDIMMGLLREALNKLTERHEILRTTFDCLPGMDDPIQVIRDEMDV